MKKLPDVSSGSAEGELLRNCIHMAKDACS